MALLAPLFLFLCDFLCAHKQYALTSCTLPLLTSNSMPFVFFISVKQCEAYVMHGRARTLTSSTSLMRCQI